MKLEDLIKKLEDTRPPQAELPGYKKQLKMALLQADYLHRRQPGVATLELAKSILKRARDAMIKSLLSRQPVWKTVTVSVLAVALVLGLSLTIPPLTTDSVYAQAEKIAKNSPEVLTAVGEVSEVQVIDISGIEGTVIAQGETNSVVAKVNLETKEVVEVVNFTIDEQAAIDIAKADARVQALLDEGATIGEVSVMYIFWEVVFAETGETVETVLEELWKTLVEIEIIGSDGINYDALVDLDAGEVVSITEREAMPSIITF